MAALAPTPTPGLSMNSDHTTLHFADYARPLWSRRWLILIAVVVATGGVYAYYASKPKVYTSSTPVFVKDPGDPVSGVPSLQSTDRSVQNQAALLYSRDIAATVASKIHYKGSASELLSRISVTSREGEDFVTVAARGDTPTEAATIANGYARQFVDLVNTSQSSRIKRALDLSRTQLKRVPNGPATQATRQALGDQIRRLELALQVPPSLTRQVDPALPPGSPSAPKPLRNAIFAFILSLLIAVGVAFGLERFDRRLKRPADVHDVYGQPLLAVLPHSNAPAPMNGDVAALSPDFREAFRVLRTNIELARLDAPPRTLVVSSAVPGEGKSTVVRNLALAYRETGKSVAVVEADLRHPTLGTAFGAEGELGLTDVLAQTASLDDVTIRVGTALPGLDELVRPAPNGSGGNATATATSRKRKPAAVRASGNGHKDVAGSLTLLLSGAKPANPPAVLASERVVEVLDELRARYDIVLIDSAPLLAVTDTVPLLRYADGAVFVGRLSYTTRDTAKRLIEFLGRIPDVELLGIVANDLSQLDASGYGYGYGYGGYGYGDGEDPKVPAKRAKAAAR
jgi:Mrp family chromosome partitioning ATPase/capsular polysaccharide biosynthesis protein